MTASPKRIDAITLLVEDLEQTKLSHQAALGMSVDFEDENC